MSENKHAARLAALRQAMHEHHVAACIVPDADPHLSEYLPAHWQARAWLSGFDGSAGTLVVTADFAGLWTDSRYFEQAERQLAGSGIALVRLQVPHQAEHIPWLAETLHEGDAVAVDGACLALANRYRLEDTLDVVDASLRLDLDLPGEIWSDRPALPQAPVYPHPPEFVSTPASDKLVAVRADMHDEGVDWHLVSALDEIAWLLNLRGSDVDCNPVFLAHLLLGHERATLFVDDQRLDAAARAQLDAADVTLRRYADIADTLAALPDACDILLDPTAVVTALARRIPDGVTIVEDISPVTRHKAIKNQAELDHIRETMRQDGIALVQGFHRIERALADGQTVTELDVADWLLEARRVQPGFVGVSFATIAGYMANGALPHYQATPEAHATLARDGLLLVDSGGQYFGGTTDITRMWAFGETTAEQRRDVTIVLKGMIALSRARFPAGVSGPQIDAIARAPLWAAGLDYGHGTGHGVGYFLNVHEGPHGIRPPSPGAALVPLEPGMISSIEPGVYKAGRHGVRHENLAVVVKAEETEFGSFLGFDTLTLCPIDTRALDVDRLDTSERQWLNAYHAHVLAELGPALAADDKRWLEQRCQPI